MQDHDRAHPVSRRALLAGLGALTVTAAVTGCSTEEELSTSAAGPTLGPTAGVPVGGGTVYPQQRVVVTQPAAGTFHAFSAVCTHQGCTVKEVVGDTINCPCHGSKFDVNDGSVVHGPAQQPLGRLDVTVEAGTLRLT